MLIPQFSIILLLLGTFDHSMISGYFNCLFVGWSVFWLFVCLKYNHVDWIHEYCLHLERMTVFSQHLYQTAAHFSSAMLRYKYRQLLTYENCSEAELNLLPKIRRKTP